MPNEVQLRELSPRTILFYARDLGTVNDGPLAVAWQLVQELFPARNVLDLTYEYWIGQVNRPIMATLTPYDVEAPLASRPPIGDRKVGDMPKIQRKLRLSEQERLLLLRIANNATLPAEVRAYVQRRYDDITQMRDAVLARITYLCLQAVTTMGPISFDEGGIRLTVDFGIPETQREVLETPWSNAEANPYEDITRWVQAVEDAQGFTPTRAITSTSVVRALLAHQAIRELIMGRNFADQLRRAPTLSEYNMWASGFGFPQLAVLDSQVWVEDAVGARSLIRLFPADKFVMLPPEPLGHLLMGTTAEAIGMVEAGTISTEEAPGLWAGIYRETDPPVQWTKAAAIAFPTFPGADRLFLAEVL
ncbi:MAG: major capsid protein [bacterium]|nr:major capsid protein [bacterium]